MINLLFAQLLSALMLTTPSLNNTVSQTTVTVEITNFRSEKGKATLGIYTTQKDYEKENEYLLKSYHKGKLVNGTLEVELSLPPGTYGIALLDDENNNGEMDFGLMMPEEGFGFSNYEVSGMVLSKPDFEEFAFEVGESPERVKIKVKYM